MNNWNNYCSDNWGWETTTAPMSLCSSSVLRLTCFRCVCVSGWCWTTGGPSWTTAAQSLTANGQTNTRYMLRVSLAHPVWVQESINNSHHCREPSSRHRPTSVPLSAHFISPLFHCRPTSVPLLSHYIIILSHHRPKNFPARQWQRRADRQTDSLQRVNSC